MKPGESKQDQQTIRDSKTAGQREVRAHAKDEAAREAERQAKAVADDHQWQADRELERALNRGKATLEKPKLALWQRFLAWVDRVA